VECLYVPATELADELGETKVANMVMLGALLRKTNLLSLDSVSAALKTTVKRKRFEQLNEAALRKGVEFVARLESEWAPVG